MNKKYLKYILAIVPALVLAGTVLYISGSGKTSTKIPTKVVVYQPDPNLFNPAVNKFSKDESKIDKNDLGGIVPHHDLASVLIAEFFQKMPNVKTIILVGTNHTDTGNGYSITGNMIYRTPFGDLATDEEIMSELVKKNLAVYDSQRLTTEHSIYVEAPFIKYYLPKAKIVPVILDSRFGMKRSLELGEALANYVKRGDVAVVGSTDFSHYLSTEETREKDRETRLAVENYDYAKIAGFRNDHVDSPATLITVLSAMQKSGGNMHFMRKADLSEMLGQSSVKSSTSYFTLYFSAKNGL